MSRSLIQCRACRTSLLDSFVALAGVSLPTRTSTFRPLLAKPETRTWTSAAIARQQTEQTSQADSDIPIPPFNTTAASSSIPWYLEVQPPQRPLPVSPLLASQDLPPIPQDAPALVQPLLEHLSIAIGLDNLSLLDLRTIQPPPALGSNLIMIIGTARSIKHLNVSADRFCRWARSNYKLRPYADGLLGRNELKLKLRRRARRMRLAQVAGRLDAGTSMEDEVTTGWICVNLGLLPDHLAETPSGTTSDSSSQIASTRLEAQEFNTEEEEYTSPTSQEPELEDTYAGFGSILTNPRIVIQMFTEEKRLEMDLEGLWDRRDTRRSTRADKLDNEVAEKLAWDHDGPNNEVSESLAQTRIVEVGKQAKETKLDTEVAEELKDKGLAGEGDGEKREEQIDQEREPGAGKRSQIEMEVEDEDAREGMGEERPMGGIGAS